MTTAQVKLWGTTIGVVSINPGEQVARFEYEADFIGSGVQVAPIHMPLSQRVYSFPALPYASFSGLPGMLADSLPDRFGNAVINAWLSTVGRGGYELNAVERLCYTGKRGMGALEYVPVLGPSEPESDELQIDLLVSLASDILSKRRNLHTGGSNAMEQILRVGTSAGGARAKAIIAWNEQTGDVRSGQVQAGDGYGYWIIKFDGVSGNKDKESEDAPRYTLIEYAYYLMAQAAGVDMSTCRLYEEGDRKHFMTRRFDRIGANGEKLHMQTLAALAHFDFNNPVAHSYEQAAGVIRQLGLGQDSVEQLFRRMVFNVVARNQDDHVKNISFLMNKTGEWQLSPAYDITYAFNPGGQWTGQHQMSVNGKRDRFQLEDLLQCGEHMDIKRAKVLEILEGVQVATGNWMAFADAAGVSEVVAERIKSTFREHLR